ncbi:MAG: hypothetical protein Tsb002_06410 [Wenzhouxiangellaceae bacterium]
MTIFRNSSMALLLCLLLSASAQAVISRGPVVILDNATPPPADIAGTVSLVLDDGGAETFIGDSGQFIWLNRFTPAAAEFPFQVEEIQVLLGTTLVTVGDPIQLLVYADTDGDGDPGTGAVLQGEFTDTVQFNDGVSFNVYTVPTPIRVDGPGDVLIAAVNRVGAEGTDDFPAAIDTTSSAGRSWVGSYLAGDVPAMPALPADEQWGTIDSFGFPGNWAIRASGTIVGPDLPPPAAVPTLGLSGLALLMLLLGLSTLILIKRNRTDSSTP